MSGLLGFSRLVDGINTRIGRWLSWLILVAVVVSADQRASSARSSIHRPTPGSSCSGCCSAPCSCCARPGRCSSNEHIRIDIVNSLFSKRTRDWIDVFGHVVFLMPFCAS